MPVVGIVSFHILPSFPKPLTLTHMVLVAIVRIRGQIEKGAKMASPMDYAPPAGKVDLRERFARLASEWKEQSLYLSNAAQMAMLKPYQRIIGMGAPAVSLILRELEREPDQWFWALESITEENPVPPEAAGRVRSMAQAWIDWGKQHGYC